MRTTGVGLIIGLWLGSTLSMVQGDFLSVMRQNVVNLQQAFHVQ
jgi:hypothetical protein